MLQRVWNKLRTLRIKRSFRRELANGDEAWQAVFHGRSGVTLRFHDGMSVVGSESDFTANLFWEIFAERCYAPAWFYTPEPRDTVLDIGANIGLFSLFMSRAAPEIGVFAFEPHPRTFELLSRNLETNGLSDRVKALNVAVSSETGSIRFVTGDEVIAGHRAASVEGQGFEVASLSLADATALTPTERISLIKIDTEGAEVEIVEPAPASVWARTQRVVIEYHTLAKRDAVVHCLQGHGYKLRVVPTRGYEHHLGLIYATRV